MQYVYFFVYLYLLLKPFYILPSGLPQASDFMLLFAFSFLLLTKNKEKVYHLLNQHYKMVFFTCCTFAVNLFYAISYSNVYFIRSSLYFCFNVIGILVFTFIFQEKKQSQIVSNILKFNIALQVLIFLAGQGRWYDSVRYMGTFNDPNQLGYFILMNVALIHMIKSIYGGSKNNILFLGLALFMIVQTGSTGMLLGFAVIVCLDILYFILNFLSWLQKNRYRLLLSAALVLPLLGILFLVIFNSGDDQIKSLESLPIIERLQQKFENGEEGNGTHSNFEDRGYDRFIYYPQYVILGSGDGSFNRFTKTAHTNEMHTTFPSILFYYGIGPTLLILSWVFDQLKKGSIKVNIPVIALLLESFTLLNHRQTLFWAIILLVGMSANQKVSREAVTESSIEEKIDG